jgi:adenylyltransferase/sulfurtransferase
VLGSLCLQVGALLATEAVKLITGVGEPLLGRVLVIDALRARTTEVPLRPAADSGTDAAIPRAASAPAVEAEAAGGAGAGRGAGAGAGATVLPQPSPIPQLTPAEALAAQRAGAVLLDVREPFETAHGVIPGSTLLPLGEVLADPSRVEAQSVVVVCQVGMRAQRAAAALRTAGVEASVLAGGIDAWNRDGAAVHA